MSSVARQDNWMPLLRTFYRMFQEAVELSVVFQRVYELFPQLLDVSRASVLLYDPALDALVSGDYIGATQPGEPHLRSQPQLIGHSISGLCFLESRTIYIPDASKSDIIPPDVVQRLSLKSTLAVPIIFGGKPIGVLRVDDCKHTDRFNEEMIEWVQLLAEQLAVVIQNARLFSSLNQRERDLHRVNDELRSTRDNARQMVQAKSGFLARISHELRTPLNAILGYTELLLDDARVNANSPMEADLAKLQSAATSLMNIINDLLDLSTIEAGKTHVRQDIVDLQHAVRDAIAKSHRSFEKRNNTLTVEPPEHAWPKCYGDAVKLRQVLTTVLAYAARLSRDSDITLSLREHNLPDQPAVEVIVTQSTVALDDDQINRMFQTFHEQEPAVEQSGNGLNEGSSDNKTLGLAIAQRLCRRMSGELAAFADPAHGTAFVVRVMRAPTDD